MIALRTSRIEWHEGALSFVAADRSMGWVGLSFRFEADGRRFDSHGVVWQILPTGPNRLACVARPGDSAVELTVLVDAEPERDAMRVRCVYRNRTPRALRLSAIVEGAGRLLCPAGRVFHVENLKRMLISALTHPVPADRRLDWGTVLCGKSHWADLGPELHYGRSEDQPYPALFCVAPGLGRGLVEAALSQDRWYRETRIASDGEGPGFAWDGLAIPRGVASVRLPPDAAIEGKRSCTR